MEIIETPKYIKEEILKYINNETEILDELKFLCNCNKKFYEIRKLTAEMRMKLYKPIIELHLCLAFNDLNGQLISIEDDSHEFSKELDMNLKIDYMFLYNNNKKVFISHRFWDIKNPNSKEHFKIFHIRASELRVINETNIENIYFVHSYTHNYTQYLATSIININKLRKYLNDKLNIINNQKDLIYVICEPDYIFLF